MTMAGLDLYCHARSHRACAWQRQYWVASKAVALSLLAILAVSACSKKGAPQQETPTRVDAAAPSPTAPARSPLQSAIPKFTLVHGFPEAVKRFKIQDGVVFCEACDIETKPHREPRPLFAFDGTKLTDLPKLLDDAKISAAAGTSVVELVRETHGGQYEFRGKWPKPLYVELRGEWDDDGNPRNGSAWVRRVFRRTADTWAAVEEDDSDSNAYDQDPGLPKDLPREFDDALVHAPRLGDKKIPVVGGDGPLLVLEEGVVNLWDGHAFQEQPASWATGDIRSVARLATGHTLVVVGTDLHVIGRDGKSEPLAWVGEEPPTAQELIIVQKHLALLGKVGKELRLYRFEADAPLAAAHTGRDKKRSSSSVKPPADATESMPAMVKFTESCQSPFVVLFTPPSRGWDYQPISSSLKGHPELQDHLTFYEFVREGIVYFGAQADTEANARTLMALHKEKVPKARPMLGCLNAFGYLAKGQEDKWDARIIPINLGAGVAL